MPGLQKIYISFRMSASESYVGKYTKQKLLGKGTFGEAWLVVSNASGRCFLLFEIRFFQGERGSASHYISVMHYLPMPLKVLRYEGAVFVGVGVEGERRQHDRG